MIALSKRLRTKAWRGTSNLYGWMFWRYREDVRLQFSMEKPTCKCDLRTSLVGDGCSVCNPEYAAQFKEDE